MENIQAAIVKLQALESTLVRVHDLSSEEMRDTLLVLVWLALADLEALPGARKAA